MSAFLRHTTRATLQTSYVFNTKMQQMYTILQSDGSELYALLEKEVEQNPALYWKKEKSIDFFPERANKTASFYTHIEQQIREQFEKKEEELARNILEDIDEKGYYTKPVEDLSTCAQNVRKKLLQLDPIGIASTNMQECLLVQLENKKKQDTLSYQVIKHYFSDFLHQRFAFLSRQLHCCVLALEQDIKRHVKPLYTRPRTLFEETLSLHIIPDIVIESNTIMIDPHIPKLFMDLDVCSTKLSKPFQNQAKFLETCLQKRNDYLRKTVRLILQVQKGFFFYGEPLCPLSIQNAAQTLEMHPATLRRIIATKYLCFDKEMFLLGYFFSRDTKGFSQKKVGYLLEQIIESENAHSPLSDEQITEKLAEKGCYLSRRTVTKYRQKLGIAKKIQRKRQKKVKILQNRG